VRIENGWVFLFRRPFAGGVNGFAGEVGGSVWLRLGVSNAGGQHAGERNVHSVIREVVSHPYVAVATT